MLSVVTGLALTMLLNGGMVNHILTPAIQHISLFTALWEENPQGALRFLLTKSVVVFAHQDARSGLNLWTYEFDSITITVYLLVALFGGRIALKFFAHPVNYPRTTALGLSGCVLLLIAVSYMSVIEHCSGATWVGFVSLYGLGFDEFHLYPFWQWLCAGLGLLAMTLSWLLILRQPNDTI